MSRRALFLAAALLVVLAAEAQALTPFARRSMARARMDAASELSSVLLPHGAEMVRHDPSVHRALGAQGVACTRRYVVEDHRFWRVAKRPPSVWRWLRNHPLPHARIGFGVLKQDGRPLAWDVTAFLREQRNVTGRMVTIALRHARGGGTAIRVDAIAVAEPRPHRAPCFTGSY